MDNLIIKPHLKMRKNCFLSYVVFALLLFLCIHFMLDPVHNYNISDCFALLILYIFFVDANSYHGYNIKYKFNDEGFTVLTEFNYKYAYFSWDSFNYVYRLKEKNKNGECVYYILSPIKLENDHSPKYIKEEFQMINSKYPFIKDGIVMLEYDLLFKDELQNSFDKAEMILADKICSIIDIA